tara:strand:- start:386 stop:826 length:441 start_codon:yes stop_codon:yes gene_type:complete
MKKLILKVKRTFRYLFYRSLNINEQIKIAEYLVENNLLHLYWTMSKADRHHSYEVFKRTYKNSEDYELLILSLLHDIGKSKINASLFFRVFSDLEIINNKKSQIYANHEIIGLKLLKENKIDTSIINYYENNLLKQKHIVLDKTDY